MLKRVQAKPLHSLFLSFKNCLLTHTESSHLFSLQRGRRNLLLLCGMDIEAGFC